MNAFFHTRPNDGDGGETCQTCLSKPFGILPLPRSPGVVPAHCSQAIASGAVREVSRATGGLGAVIAEKDR